MWDLGYTDDTEREQSRRLAEARQQLAHTHAECHLPTWRELTDHEREVAMLDARNYLRAAKRCGLIAL